MATHGQRVGRYKMVCDISGLVYWDDEMVRNWDGAWVHHSKYESRQPQDFVRAKSDPGFLRIVRPQSYDANTPNGGSLGVYVGNSSVRVNEEGPAAHLYDYGIGVMVIVDAAGNNGSFIVR